MNSKHMKYIPKGHVDMPNVLFAPLNIEENTVGVIGLSNKKGDFTEEDARIVSAFGNLCAIALRKSLTKQRETEMLNKVNALNESLELINSILKHDLVNELQTVMNTVELMEIMSEDTEMHSKINERLTNSVDLIHKMNELEQSIREDMKKPKRMDLSEVINVVIQKNKDPYIQITSEGKGTVLADQALYSVIDNLIGNAIKHSESTRIHVSITQTEGKHILEVKDTGVGLPEEIMGKINSNSYVIDRSDISHLGLYIVCKTVERYNGEIQVEANHPKGTIVRIIFDDPDSKTYH